MMVTCFTVFWSWFLSCSQQFILLGLGIFTGVLFLGSSSIHSIWMYQDFMSVILIILSIYLLVLMKLMASAELNLSMLLIMLTAVLIILFSVDNILMFYILFEMSLIPMSLMILGWGFQPERLSASLYMLFYTISTSFPFLGFIFYSEVSSFSELLTLESLSLNWLTTMVIMAPFLVKLPMFMFHLWLPKAHVEAPSYGSMILAGVLLKLGGFGLWRLAPMLGSSGLFLGALSVSGAACCGLFVNAQTDVKAMIAYSSVVHMGLIAFSFIFAAPLAMIAGLMMMVAHGVCSSGLFCLMTLAYERMTSRSLIISQGILSITPTITMFVAFLLLMNLSAPPSLNLISEINMIYSMVSWENLSLLWIALLIVFSLVYSLTLFFSYFHGPLSSYFSVPNESMKELSLSFFHSFWWIISPLLVFLFEIY